MSLPPAYSYLLHAHALSAPGNGPDVFPPLGYKWLITDIQMYCGPDIVDTTSYVLDLATGVALAFWAFPAGTISNSDKSIRNCVVEGYSGLYVYSSAPNAGFFISGKQLAIV